MTESQVNEVNRLAAIIATKAYADRIKFIAVNVDKAAFAVSYEPGFTQEGYILTPGGSREANGERAEAEGHLFKSLSGACLQQGIYKVGEE